MIQVIKKFLNIIIRIFSHIYTYHRHQWFKNKRNGLYTIWIRNFLGEVGEKSRFERPLLLQGGGHHHIKIGSSTVIGHHTVLGCWVRYGKEHYNPVIMIGNNCSFGEYCHITAVEKITIGDGLLTGRFVYIGDNSHGGLSIEGVEIPPAHRRLTSKGEVRIGRNVWLGDKVSIFGGVTIGDNVIIGAGSIVTHDIPSNSLAIGSPAKVVKYV